MSDEGAVIRFKKLSHIYSVKTNTTEDLLVLSNKILKDTDTIVKSLNNIKEGDVLLENDFIKLVDILKNKNESKPIRMSKKLTYLVMSECMTRNEVELWKIIISRMYLRGIREIVVQALIKYLLNTVKQDEEEEYKELRVMLNTEATRGMCCKALKYMAKFLYIEKVGPEYVVCADSHKYHNMIRKTISIMTSSMVTVRNPAIGYSMFTLFHPYNHSNLPCIIKFMIIDVFEEEVKAKLLLYMAVIFADSRKTRTMHATMLSHLAACMSRILRQTRLSHGVATPDLSALVTKGVSENLRTLDAMKRLAAMTVAEAYAASMANNRKGKQEKLDFSIGEIFKTITPAIMCLETHKSKVIINPNFSKIRKELEVHCQGRILLRNSNRVVYQVLNEVERGRFGGAKLVLSTESDIPEELWNEDIMEEEMTEVYSEDRGMSESSGFSEDRGMSESSGFSEDRGMSESSGFSEDEEEEEVESFVESDHEYSGYEEMQEDGIEDRIEEEENKAFLDYIFKEVPSIEAKTVEGRVKETWLKPPQHIVQCYERLLSKPARGDVDYENINEHELDRMEEETVENQILRVSQTLIWLPRVIRKNETILEKYAVPLSRVLLKLSDLELYKEKVEEIARAHGSKVAEQERELIEVASKDPEDLILVSLVLMSFYSPYEVLNHYTEHMFDREVTVNAKLKMMLCIQYTLMGYLEQMDGEELMKKVLERGMRFNVEDKMGIEKLKMRKERKTKEKIELKLREETIKMAECEETKKEEEEEKETEEEEGEVKERRKEQWKPSKKMKQTYLETMMKLLLKSLKIYKKIREEGDDTTDEEVATTIVQTLGILITMNEKKVENVEEIEEMVKYFSQIEGDPKFMDSVKLVEQALQTRQIEKIEGMK